MSLPTPHTILAQQFVYARLAADATLASLGIYDDDVPGGVGYPLVQIRNTIPATHRAVIGDKIIYATTRFLVVAITEFRTRRPSWSSLVDPASRIHAQLHQATGAVGGGQVYRSSESGEYRQSYTHEGIYYRELGAFYDVLVQQEPS